MNQYFFIDFYLIIREVMSVGKRSYNILTILGKILRFQRFVRFPHKISGGSSLDEDSKIEHFIPKRRSQI